MPNRYEREIEEILRNLEQTEPRQGLGQKFGERLRRRPPSRPITRERQSLVSRFTIVEWLLCSAVICALVAGGYSYIIRDGNVLVGNIFTGVLACIGFVCLVLVACSHFLFQPRRSGAMKYGNVTITPIRRGPLNTMRTRWNLFWMRRRFRGKDEQR